MSDHPALFVGCWQFRCDGFLAPEEFATAGTLAAVRKPQRDLSDAPFSEVFLALPRIGVAGFLIGFIGSWVKPVENVVTIVDRLQFGALMAACFAVMIPVILLCLKLWNWMWARAGF